MEEDKYPVDSDRRRFVKGVVGGASLIGVGTTAAAAVNTLTSPSGAGGGPTTFFGVENVAGPAPRGMPLIPVKIDSEGFLKGVYPEVGTKTVAGREITVAKTPDFGGSGVAYSANWFQYCGVQTYPGVYPNADQDNYFRYAGSSKYEWQKEKVSGGEKVHIDDFSNYETWANSDTSAGRGKPASATWRSQDVDSSSTMPVEIIRSPIIERRVKNGAFGGQAQAFMEAATAEGFLVHLNKCTHFCCVPGFATSSGFGAKGKIYCQCHQSVYNPFSIVKKEFVALPRPEKD